MNNVARPFDYDVTCLKCKIPVRHHQYIARFEMKNDFLLRHPHFGFFKNATPLIASCYCQNCDSIEAIVFFEQIIGVPPTEQISQSISNSKWALASLSEDYNIDLKEKDITWNNLKEKLIKKLSKLNRKTICLGCSKQWSEISVSKKGLVASGVVGELTKWKIHDAGNISPHNSKVIHFCGGELNFKILKSNSGRIPQGVGFRSKRLSSGWDVLETRVINELCRIKINRERIPK